MDLSADLPTKNLDLRNFGDFWGDGADSAHKMDTLAGRRVSSTPGKRLAEARRASHSASLGEVMTHPYTTHNHNTCAHMRVHTHAHLHTQPCLGWCW